MVNGWTISFPKRLLESFKLLDVIVLEATGPLIVDNVNFPDAIAITGTGYRPLTLEKFGFKIQEGVIPEPENRPSFELFTIWLHEGQMNIDE